MPTRILIADDHGVLRAGLRALLNSQPGLEVIGEAADGPTALRQALELRPDIVLLDLSMPGLDGIQVTRQLKQACPEVRALILTGHEDESLLREAIHAGALGYIVKRAVETELLSAIHAIASGNLYVHPAMTRALLKDLSPALVPDESTAEPLTQREREVLRLLAQGHTNRQAADLLGVSVRTVESHRANLTSKLGLASRAELVRYAKERGWLE